MIRMRDHWSFGGLGLFLIAVSGFDLPVVLSAARPQTVVETTVIRTGPGGAPSGDPESGRAGSGGAIGPGLRIGGPAPLPPIARGAGVIVGLVTDSDSPRPVAGAVVTLRLSGSTPLRILADAQGRFAFRSLPAGSFSLDVTKPGYADGAFGRVRPGGPSQPVVLTDGARLGNLAVPIWKFAAIEGTVVDDRGEPLVATTVRVLKRSFAGGVDRFVLGASAETDDRGYYRIGMLEPGAYVVCVPISRQDALRAALEGFSAGGARGGMTGVVMALPAVAAVPSGEPATMSVRVPTDMFTVGFSSDQHALMYRTQFYSASAAASRATSIRLTSGQVFSGVDFQMQPIVTKRVSGTIVNVDGLPPGAALTLVPVESDGALSPLETATAPISASGSFEFPAVPPGQYSLRAATQPRPPMVSFSMNNGAGVSQVSYTFGATAAPAPLPTIQADPTLWAEQQVSVDTSDVVGLSLTLRPGSRVSAQLDFSGGASPSDDAVARTTISLQPVGTGLNTTGGAVSGRCDAAGHCETRAALPGTYVIRVAGLPAGWSLKGAMLNGRDVADAPFELGPTDVAGIQLSLTSLQTELTGNVTSTNDGGSGRTLVVVFPAEQDRWVLYGDTPRRMRTARVDDGGAFTIRGLPAGRYYAAAIPDRTAADWQTPAVLGGLMGQATAFELGDGQKASVALKVVPR